MTKLRRYYTEPELQAMKTAADPGAMCRFRGAVEHSPEEIRELQEMIAERPELARVAEATVQYANERGGLTRECFRLLHGPWFGEPWIMTPAACAHELGITLEELEAILLEAEEPIRARLEGGDGRAAPGAPSCRRST